MALFPIRGCGRLARASATVALAAAAVGCPNGDEAGEPVSVTYARDIAPILDRHCVSCHREGQMAPFPLLTVDDVVPRAEAIVREVEAHRMPPWPPANRPGWFRHERRLEDSEIERIVRWRQQGAAAGNEDDRPEPPRFDGGWQLGAPDVVVSLPEPYSLPAQGDDFIRNFLVPLPALAGRLVRAIELDPQNRRVVHHANVLADATGAARELDRRDPGPGWAGMVGAVAPGGHFLGWTPGRTPREFPAGTAWRIEPGTDLVVQLHLMPRGRVETVRPRVALYFTSETPRRTPTTIHLGSTAIDLPAGARDIVVEDRWRLPVAVEALAIYPHAHYLGSSFRLTASLPDQSELDLLTILRWDFFWQDEYELAEPLRLPAGTELVMHWTYDNTAGNARNPFSPPRRVVWGPSSRNEMADVWIQSLPAREQESKVLKTAVFEKDLEIALDGFERLVRRDPRDAEAWGRIGQILVTLQRMPEALEALQRALALRPDDAHLYYNRGLALVGLGRLREAVASFERATALDSEHARAWGNQGAALLALDRIEESVRSYLRAAELEPSDPELIAGAGLAMARAGRLDDALGRFEAALRLAPESMAAHTGLAETLARLGDRAAAEEQLYEVLRIDPGNVEAHRNLAALAANAGDPVAALEQLEQALAIAPDDAETHYLAGLAQSELEHPDRALAAFERAAELAPDDGRVQRELGTVLELLGRDREAVAAYRRARETFSDDPVLALQLGSALIRVGRRDEAIGPLRDAVRLDPDNETARQLLRALGH